MQNNSVAAMEKQVDTKAYSDEELISIKTTLNLPYYTSSPEYERAYGSIIIDGKDYEYVKRKVYQDTLELLCLPNHTKTKLKAVSNELAKSSVDGQESSSQKRTTVLKISLPDFCQPIKTYTASFVCNTRLLYYSLNNQISLAGYISRQERPPQTMQASLS